MVSSPNHSRNDRRRFLSSAFSASCAPFFRADIGKAEVLESLNLDMKQFVDPIGLFSIKVPTSFFTLRRSSKGDLPDENTGKGRRGSSIFTAGDMGKAEVIAIER